MKRRKLPILLAALAVVLGIAAANVQADAPLPGSTEQESSSMEADSTTNAALALCYANAICTFKKTGFNSPYFNILCEESGLFYALENLYSALNRCGNKTNWLRHNGTVVACMNPGGERPSPGAYNEVWVAAQYGAFC